MVKEARKKIHGETEIQQTTDNKLIIDNGGNRKPKKNALEELIEKSGGCAVIDGALSTRLEQHGIVFHDKALWSAACLITQPQLIKQVHWEYLEAGADIVITSSYQATIPGFVNKGLSVEESENLLRRSVELARDARDSFWSLAQQQQRKSNGSGTGSQRRRALVAAGIGSYGAYLADGSEYSGIYGPYINVDKLKDFHRRRLQLLVEAGADILAFETIPNKMEAEACVELLHEENVSIPSWICFSSVDGKHAASGESFEDCLKAINKSDKVNGVGFNCTPPQFTEELIHSFKKVTEKAIVVYPNRGEVWDGQLKEWMPASCFDDHYFSHSVKRWKEAGANVIGGCCRTTPLTIRAISDGLKR